jgi:hypothetical protein
MAQSHALSALVDQRNHLAARITALQQEVKRLDADVRTLDVAIKIIEPDFKLTSLKAKRKNKGNVFFEHGEATRFVLCALREGGILSTTGIAELAVRQKGYRNHDMQALKACILTILRRQRVKGVVIEKGRYSGG